MINITKQGNNVIVTSDNPNSFYIGNGELSVPLNTIYYVLDDESDFIQFNSTEEGRILFNGTIGQIQVNGNIVNRENILMELDNVFNSAATGGEGGTAGVLSINGYDGYINLKSINGQSLIGSGDITIEGGSDLISIDANNSSKSLNVGSGNTGDLYGTILVGRDIVNNYNAAVLIGNGVTNTVGDRNNIAVNICNSLMADSSGNMYFWKNGKVEKLADYAVYKEWSGTQAEYNALGTYDDNTIYNIIEG